MTEESTLLRMINKKYVIIVAILILAFIVVLVFFTFFLYNNPCMSTSRWTRSVVYFHCIMPVERPSTKIILSFQLKTGMSQKI